MAKQQSIERLQREHERLVRRLEKLESKQYPGDELVEFYHMGLVGGSGKAVRALNKRKTAALDQIIDNAKECNRLRQRINGLESKMKSFTRNPPSSKKPTRAKRTSATKPPQPVSEGYNTWARSLWDDMETRISRCRSQFVDGTWDNLHNQSLRGEMAIYIAVQAEINAEHLRGNQVKIDKLLAMLDKEEAKAARQAAAEPHKAWLKEHTTAEIATVVLVKALLSASHVSA